MDTEDDLDDTPLFTRQSSQKMVLRESFSKSIPSLKTSISRSDSIQPAAKQLSHVKYGLPFMQANFFATTLEDVLTQIRILGECNNQLCIYKTNKEIGELRRNKYGIPPSKDKDELAGVDPKRLEDEHHKLNKLANDRKMCLDVLTATYLELALHRAYGPLVEARKSVIRRNHHNVTLVEDEARNAANNRELKRQLRQQRNRSRSVIYDTNVAVEKLRNDVEDATLNKEVRSRYIDKWELAREEQNTKRIEDKEKQPNETIAFYRKQLESEQRVHYEQELHTNILINDVLRQLDLWVDKYDEDTASVDLRIQIKKIDATTQKEKREEMEARLARHAEKITKWNQFKEDRERALQYRLKMTAAAHVVQAWWRGLLVRQQLGPYKPRKKTATKSKSEKKKK